MKPVKATTVPITVGANNNVDQLNLPAREQVEDLSCCVGRVWDYEPVMPPVVRLVGSVAAIDDGLQRLLTATRAVTTDQGLDDLLALIVVGARDLVGSTGAMQRFQRWISDAAQHRHLAAQTDNLDAAIRDLRTPIYGLDRDPREVWRLSARIQQVMDETTGHLGFAPTLTMDPGLDLPPGSATPHNLLAVLREALTNVARHAHAEAVHITVTGGTSITMTVADDGHGLGQQPRVTTAARGHGLANMADRAMTLGGPSTLSANPGSGVTLRCSAPMTSVLHA